MSRQRSAPFEALSNSEGFGFDPLIGSIAPKSISASQEAPSNLLRNYICTIERANTFAAKEEVITTFVASVELSRIHI